MNPRLSLCCVALDEQERIGDLFRSVAGLADELVVGVDTRTIDHTAGLAEARGARVIPIGWRDDFSYARNLTIDAAAGEWILVLDADERLSPAGADAIRDILAVAGPQDSPTSVTGVAFLIGQFDLAGKLLAVQASSGRLFRRRPEIRYRGVVHEEPVWLPAPERTNWCLITGVLAIHHVGYDPAVWAQRGKQERNVRLLEHRLAANPEDAYAQAKLAQTRALEG